MAGSIAGGGAAVLLGGAAGLRRAMGRSNPQASVVLPAAVGPPATVGSEAAAEGFREVEGLSPLVTPNRSFYRIDEALITPSVDVGSWRLQVTGMVDRPFELTYDELLALPLVERHVTLSCVSNEVGGSLVGNGQVAGRAPGRSARPGRGAARGHPARRAVGRRLHRRLPGRAWPSTAATPWWRSA